jgi:taurine--2-oxoglutarate transaminase
MPHVPTERLSSQEVVDATRQLNYGTWRYQKNWTPLHIVDAQDCHFIDSAGNATWTFRRS